MTTEQLVEHLRQAFTSEGQWNFPEVRKFTREVWRAWIEARLRGKDPWAPYAREEYPATAAFLFVGYAREAKRQRIKTDPCGEAAADFLAALNPDQTAGEQSHVLKNALELVGHLRARNDQALQTVRDWIGRQRLLTRSDSPIELHRTALNVLAALQKRGILDDEPIWQAWMQPWESGGPERRYVFVPAAFSGLAMSTITVPAQELRLLLRCYNEMRAQGTRLPISGAILALWVDRESDETEVRNEVGEAIQQSDDSRADWETIRRCADRLYAVKPWDQMVSLVSGARTQIDVPHPLWETAVYLRPGIPLQPAW